MEYWKNRDIHDLNGEVWKPIKGYKGYQVSNLGRVKSTKRKVSIILKQLSNKAGYLHVSLSVHGKETCISVHTLVATYFLDNLNNYNEVNHKNEVKADNSATNLEWCTRKYNNNYGTFNEQISRARSKPVIATNIKTGKSYLFSSAKSCSDYIHGNGHVSRVCRGESKYVKGYYCKYLPDDFDFESDYETVS